MKEKAFISVRIPGALDLPRNFVGISTLALLIVSFVFLVTACSNEKEQPESETKEVVDTSKPNGSPVDYIEIFEEMPNVPPGFGLNTPVNPHPENLQISFSPGEKMFIGLVINRENFESTIFSRFTVFNTRTNTEQELTMPDDIGIFEPGQVSLVAFSNPWPVPELSDIYEIRVYLDDEIAASALFEVK